MGIKASSVLKRICCFTKSKGAGAVFCHREIQKSSSLSVLTSALSKWPLFLFLLMYSSCSITWIISVSRLWNFLAEIFPYLPLCCLPPSLSSWMKSREAIFLSLMQLVLMLFQEPKGCWGKWEKLQKKALLCNVSPCWMEISGVPDPRGKGYPFTYSVFLCSPFHYSLFSTLLMGVMLTCHESPFYYRNLCTSHKGNLLAANTFHWTLWDFNSEVFKFSNDVSCSRLVNKLL